MRWLVVAAAIAAILSTIAAPCIWPLQREQLLARLAIALGTMATIAAMASFSLLRWRRLGQKNGQLLMRLSNTRLRWTHVASELLALYLAWVMYQSMLGWVISATPPNADAMVILCGYIVVLFQLPQLIRAVLPAEAREAGLILANGRVLPWSAVQSYRWGGPSPSTVTLQLDHEVVSLPLLAQDKEAFDRLLHEMCTK